MYTPRARRIGRRETEELVSGGRARSDRTELLRLLELASAPPQRAELFGREQALAAFLRAQREPLPVQSRAPAVIRAISRALAVKAAAALTVFLVGGVALAASTGSLPAEVQHDAHNLLSPLGVKVPDATLTPTRDPGTHRRSLWPTLSPTPSPSPSQANAVGLCQAWQVAKKARQSPSPAIQVALVDLAGGADKISTYCTKVLAPLASPSSARPSHSASPSPSATKHTSSTRPPVTPSPSPTKR
jgi:hypothetical protein